MVKFGFTDNRPRVVLLSSIITSIALVSFFLFGALFINSLQSHMTYTQVDIAAGSIFVFVITLIISLSLWPNIMDWFEKREKVGKISK